MDHCLEEKPVGVISTSQEWSKKNELYIIEECGTLSHPYSHSPLMTVSFK